MEAIKNFLFVLRQFKTSGIVNLSGLSVAFAVFAVIIIQVKYDFTYDKCYPAAADIYKHSYFVPGEKEPRFVSSQQIPEKIKDALPEVKAYCVMQNMTGEITIPSSEGEKKTVMAGIISATPGFTDVFGPTVIAGNTAGLFIENDKAMISRKTAERLFGDDDPVGKVFYSGGNQLTVIAVYEDFPKNSSINNGIYTKIKEMPPSEWSFQAYYKMAKADVVHINEKINALDLFDSGGEEMPDDDQKYIMNCVPLSDFYLHYSGKGSLNTTLSLLSIGIVMIVIAFINFINLTVALIPSRVRNVNIRRILGVGLRNLRITIALEAVFLSMTAFVLSVFYITVFNDAAISSFFSADLTIENNVPVLAVIFVGLLVLSFLLGLYPAFYVTSINPAMALSGTFSLSSRGIRMRNLLIVVQFAASIVLIIISVFIKIQHDYMQDYDWGIRKENIVYLPGKDMKSNIKSFKNDVLQNPSVVGFTTAGSVPGYVGMGWGRMYQSKMIQITAWPVAHDFLDFFGIPVLYGNDFDPDDASGREKVIFNEEFLRRYDFDKDIVGGTFETFTNNADIVGIAKDVNFESLHQPIKPMAFVIINAPWWQDNFVFLKLSGRDIRSTIDYIQEVWKKHNDKPFEITFLDAKLDELYKTENNLAKLISVFGLIAVIIAVMGVYGLIVFNARYKAREIAIRKVNGSTIEEIMLLLNRNMLIQVGIAFVIPLPAAYLIVHRWLENFAYKTTIHWWVFLFGGVAVLIITILTVSIQSYKAASRNPTKALNNV
ncbi:MAG: ABC transporter permease [Tannerella sp.]|jgi:putative ABC transport system permease protein|nr:ABC transporter permease [Tannerella sp.]